MTSKSLVRYIPLLTLLLLGSCSQDFLIETNPNAIATSDYYKTENDVLLALNGVYNALRDNSGIAEGSGLYSEERSDNTGRNDNQSNAGEPFQFNAFALLPSNSYLQTHWTSLYQIITRANYVLAGSEKVTYAKTDTKAQYQAEAKFIRALIYFQLVRKWGDVPLVTKPLTTVDEVTTNTFREKKEKVYAQIVADLTDVVNSPLPDVRVAADKGRVSKVAGNALLGQVYLTMATTLDQANRATNLAQAKTYLTYAYSKRTFGTLKEIAYADVFDVTKKTTNSEAIFQIVYKQGDINYSSSIAANNQAQGETINSLKTTTGVGGNVTPDLVKDYEDGDVRKDYSIKYANAAVVKDYFITKFRDASSAAGTSGYGGNDWLLIRYADVILMLAEVNMYLGDEATAIDFLDQVRERAKLPLYNVAKTNPAYNAKYPTLKLAILHERRVELAFENQRWFDLLRFFTPDELVTYFKSKSQADFGAAQLSNFGTKDYYYPIPFNEYKLNPSGMYQNPGY
ncbi:MULTISPECIES: RagB/SusD family nutrient uptake outer membrane protein [unclassified Spirosoma]|uniref:RagB/SusD family nutrient uptake outer membrane protein n=1 Tax=unclassified Spirosoma TaxID=2621999 RepID=UPI000968D738|nr:MULTISPECIES: RagB/SusD family nutrient uptake outer membrane protein [unclassified Spirosoma]MBN8824172.1 RagB/SusD family nutrient uptake outer membrane protein [Spirosoma sp.]OJW78910.1 MAG: RagB/SusD family nutrient uptake outer membrane protein [Spirosoma sp. 48-14]